MNILFSTICIIWLLSEILLNRLLRIKSEDKQNADANSLGMIWMVIVISVTGAVFIAQRFFQFAITANPNIVYIGEAIIVIGIILRLWVIRTMGKLFTVQVTIKVDHHLKTDGFYKIIRHPSYAASLLSFIGFGLALDNWISLFLVFILVLMAFVRRIQIEEKVLIRQFGEAYLNYSQKTKRLIPFIY